MQTMHLLPGVAIQPNLELKTRPKPVLGSLPLAFALPGLVIALPEVPLCLCLVRQASGKCGRALSVLIHSVSMRDYYFNEALKELLTKELKEVFTKVPRHSTQRAYL